MTITIRVEGAQPEEIVRGLLAAQDVFDKAGVTPDQAATARFIIEGWDIRGFVGKVPEEELAICTVWDEADQAAVQACCTGWAADKVPSSADLELSREPQRFRFTSEEEKKEWLFQTADAGILEEMCEEGYFDDGRPEDEVAFLLDDWDFKRLTEEQRRLFDERLYPLMRIWFFERERFEEEYNRVRNEQLFTKVIPKRWLTELSMRSGSRACYTSLMSTGSMLRPRWLPEKNFPSYAYLPGRQPHPVRDPLGHSYQTEAMPVAAGVSLDSDIFLWGLDLFNHGYYWEAHEAWEGLWQVADRGGPLRMLFKGLILLSAAGVKIREGKQAAAVRHAGRAAGLLRRLMNTGDDAFERALGMPPTALAEQAEAAARSPATLQATALGQPQPVFDFILGSSSSASQLSPTDTHPPD